MKKVIILGGYGNFGKRIVENLSSVEGIILFIAGRNKQKAERLKETLNKNALAKLSTLEIDINAKVFNQQIESISPDIVIHTSGPFQGQDLRVPQACLTSGAHYIDLSDDRAFVCNIKSLDQVARDRNCLLVSGASSVPGLSSAVLGYYKSQFSVIDSIDITIAPGNKAERGEATIRGILSYIGRPFKVFDKGRWENVYGWMSPRRFDFSGIVGKRWLANVDIPDLELFPEQYSVKSTVRFQAGLELPFLHWIMVGMAYLTKVGLVKNWTPLTKAIVTVSNLFKPLGTDIGGMNIEVSGKSNQDTDKNINWTLYADNGVGPYIPTISAIIIARKLLSGELSATGARPCIELYNFEDFIPYAEKLHLNYTEHSSG